MASLSQPILIAPERLHATVMGPSFVVGFGAAAITWIAWFITHSPWVGLPEWAQTALVLLAWFAATVVGCTLVDKQRAPGVGFVSGMIASAIGLLLLGAKLGTLSDPSQPGALGVVGGFILLGAVIGVTAGWVGSLLCGPRWCEVDWRAAFAQVLVLWAAPLLCVGGLVTSTNSGMAVPDWPTTFGANMFLYPLGSASTQVFLEHSHRLFGSALGLAALVNFLWMLKAEAKKSLRWGAFAIGVAVLAQAVIGAVRVLWGSVDAATDNRWWSMLHGIGAQLIFSLIVANAVIVSQTYKFAARAGEGTQGARLRIFATAALHTTFLQMIFGAMYRHTRSSHALWTHAGFSILVVVFTVLAGFLALSMGQKRDLTTPHRSALERVVAAAGGWQLVVVALQFIMGWVTFALGSRAVEAATLSEALLRTSHQANGALLVAASTVVYVCARRLSPRNAGTESVPIADAALAR